MIGCGSDFILDGAKYACGEPNPENAERLMFCELCKSKSKGGPIMSAGCGHETTGARHYKNHRGGRVMICTNCYLAIVSEHEKVIKTKEAEIVSISKRCAEHQKTIVELRGLLIEGRGLVDEMAEKIQELEKDRARWKLRAEFLVAEGVDDHWRETEMQADPFDAESDEWIEKLDALIFKTWTWAAMKAEGGGDAS